LKHFIASNQRLLTGKVVDDLYDAGYGTFYVGDIYLIVRASIKTSFAMTLMLLSICFSILSFTYSISSRSSYPTSPFALYSFLSIALFLLTILIILLFASFDGNRDKTIAVPLSLNLIPLVIQYALFGYYIDYVDYEINISLLFLPSLVSFLTVIIFSFIFIQKKSHLTPLYLLSSMLAYLLCASSLMWYLKLKGYNLPYIVIMLPILLLEFILICSNERTRKRKNRRRRYKCP